MRLPTSVLVGTVDVVGAVINVVVAGDIAENGTVVVVAWSWVLPIWTVVEELVLLI